MVELTYITRRGHWYDISWKGYEEKSGGLAMNIGIHFFDLLLWLFGGAAAARSTCTSHGRWPACLELERARVNWFLSVDCHDLPDGYLEAGKTAFRSITLNGQEVEFSEGSPICTLACTRRRWAGAGSGSATPGLRSSWCTRSGRERSVAHRGEGHRLVSRK